MITMNFDAHDFYCIKCGNKGIPLNRKKSLQHGKFHRKRLYCPFCKIEVNHIECRNQADIEEFKMNFANGDYIEEAQESIEFVKGHH